jgi:hypothetical protein
MYASVRPKERGNLMKKAFDVGELIRPKCRLTTFIRQYRPTSNKTIWRSSSAQLNKPRVCVYTRKRRYSSASNGVKRCFVALGSNMLNRLIPIESACRAIDHIPNTRIVRTSGLWNTKAMYVTDQDDFLNGVCEVDTH